MMETETVSETLDHIDMVDRSRFCSRQDSTMLSEFVNEV
jgi:hypothetical protein